MTAPVDVDSRASSVRRAGARMDRREPPRRGRRPVDDRTLQQRIFDAGFAGIAFPKEYGGAGLTLPHQKVFFDTADDGPARAAEYMVSIGMMAPPLLDHGSER